MLSYQIFNYKILLLVSLVVTSLLTFSSTVRAEEDIVDTTTPHAEEVVGNIAAPQAKAKEDAVSAVAPHAEAKRTKAIKTTKTTNIHCPETGQITLLKQSLQTAHANKNTDDIDSLSKELGLLQKSEQICLSKAGIDASQFNELGDIAPAAGVTPLGRAANFARDVFAAPVELENLRQLSPQQP